MWNFTLTVLFLVQMCAALDMKGIIDYQRGLTSIISRYDAFIIDQWGVLHDGKVLYPEALATMNLLKAASKKTIMLSNSSKRVGSSIVGLKKVGLDPAKYFDDIVTSGELAWNFIEGGGMSGNKVFLFGNGQDDDEYISSLDCVVACPEDADFILARGTFSICGSNVKEFPDAFDLLASEALNEGLKVCASRSLPMVCSNPDFYRPGSGQPMPGKIAATYEALMGGRDSIKFFGKPYKDSYEACFKSLPGVDKARVAGIGDSLDHDIVGAARNGVKSIFIENGVHCTTLGSKEGAPDSLGSETVEALIESIARESGDGDHCIPTHSVPCFQP